MDVGATTGVADDEIVVSIVDAIDETDFPANGYSDNSAYRLIAASRSVRLNGLRTDFKVPQNSIDDPCSVFLVNKETALDAAQWEVNVSLSSILGLADSNDDDQEEKKPQGKPCFPELLSVGLTGFEPATSTPPV